MSILVDLKYAQLLSSRLPKYKIKKTGPLLVNFRCNICGDSKTNPNKCRAYLYERKGAVRYACHNCGYSSKIGFYLKQHVPDLFSEYLMDTFEENRIVREADPILTPKKPEHEKKGGSLAGLKRISQLHHEHPAKQYVVNRQIPPETHSRLYFTQNFGKWVNSLDPTKYEKPPKLDPRLILPFLDQKGTLFAVQGRAISDKQQQRYITIRFDEERPKVFGVDRIDPNRRVWVFEGPIDSLFVPNALAMAGSDVSADELVRFVGCDKDRIVKVFDNEPRNAEIVARMERDIESGLKIVIWPNLVKQKDVNDMILKGGLTIENIMMLMNKSVTSGLEAQLKLAAWRKC